MRRRALGFGATSRTRVDDVLALVQSCIAACGPVEVVATIDRRGHLGAAVAHALGLPLQLLSADALAAVPAAGSRSSLAQRTTGTANVAEAAALTAAGAGASLVGERRVGTLCTCAVAERA